MKIPLVDLRATYLPIREELLRRFDAILDGMQLFLGPQQRALEVEFAAFCDVPHGISYSNGTDAIYAALRALGVGPGHEVIAPAHTFFATIEAIVHAGAMPVLVDVEPETLTIDPREVRAALTPATRAIVPVHLYGHPADMDPILELARERGIHVVEDAAQAHGARYRGRRCGSLGDLASFSFYVTKNLGAFGEGGFVCTRDAGLAEQVRLLRHHGHVSKFEHALIGHNFRMDELQAAVLRLKLPGLEAGNARRREIARRYRELLPGVRQLVPRADCEAVHHVHPIRVRDRDALRDYLAEQGIETGIHYKIPGHLQPALRRHPHRHGNMKVTEEACRELLSLPIYPELTDEQLEYVALHVRRFLERSGSARAS